MLVVYFYDNKNLLLSQFVKTIPAVGDALTIKGRKGKVASVSAVEEGKFHVQLTLETVKPKGAKGAVLEDPKKKKR